MSLDSLPKCMGSMISASESMGHLMFGKPAPKFLII